MHATAIPMGLPGADTRVAIFVEPSPFSHVSGMRIRFTNLIKGLRELGNDVTVVTPCIAPPKEFCGAKVRHCYLTLHAFQQEQTELV